MCDEHTLINENTCFILHTMLFIQEDVDLSFRIKSIHSNAYNILKVKEKRMQTLFIAENL